MIMGFQSLLCSVNLRYSRASVWKPEDKSLLRRWTCGGIINTCFYLASADSEHVLFRSSTKPKQPWTFLGDAWASSSSLWCYHALTWYIEKKGSFYSFRLSLRPKVFAQSVRPIWVCQGFELGRVCDGDEVSTSVLLSFLESSELNRLWGFLIFVSSWHHQRRALIRFFFRSRMSPFKWL